MNRLSAQKYTDQINRMMGKKAEFFRVSTEGTHPEMWVLFYPNSPAADHLTAFTFGLSEVSCPSGAQTKTELTLCLQSKEADWALALGHIAESQKGKIDFSTGSVFDLGGPIADDTKMSGFFLFDALLLPESTQPTIQLPDRTVNLMGAYPLYSSEIDRIKIFGLDLFFTNEDYDPYSVIRPARGENKKEA